MQYEKVCKQMVRREQYLYERDRSHGLYYCKDETELYKLCPDLYDTEKKERGFRRRMYERGSQACFEGFV